MRDALGIVLHHDAITGTGDQIVADDYSRRIAVAIEKNARVYHKHLANLIRTKTGYVSLKDWEQCTVTNATYLDCPISELHLNKNMGVIVQNPSQVELNEVSFQVANGNIKVQAFNGKDMRDVEAYVVCSDDYK